MYKLTKVRITINNEKSSDKQYGVKVKLSFENDELNHVARTYYDFDKCFSFLNKLFIKNNYPNLVLQKSNFSKVNPDKFIIVYTAE